MDCDLLIENVNVVDGSGSGLYHGTPAVPSGRIEAVGKNSCAAKVVIDGRGRALALGSIDVYTHDDLYLLRSPEMLPKLSQVVTTVIAGNCGISAGPATVKHDLRHGTSCRSITAPQPPRPELTVPSRHTKEI